MYTVINCGRSRQSKTNTVLFLVFGDILIFGKADYWSELWLDYCGQRGLGSDDIPIMTGLGNAPQYPDRHPTDDKEWNWDDCTNPADYEKIRQAICDHADEIRLLTFK